MKYWKISNKTKDKNIKIAVSEGTARRAVGIILSPDQFCICEASLTTPIDTQWKKGFIEIEEIENSFGLPLAKALDISELDKAKESFKQFSSPDKNKG